MGELLVDLLLARRREASGSISANRFEFQRTWALCHLLQLHATANDYVLVMEFHDDVIVLDSEKSPRFVDFFQVKTRTKRRPWSLSDLSPAVRASQKPQQLSLLEAAPPEPAQSAPPDPQSILGKLVAHLSLPGISARAMNLVSNETYNMPLANGMPSTDRDSLCLAELRLAELEKLRLALQKELQLSEPPPLNSIFLLVTNRCRSGTDAGAREIRRTLGLCEPTRWLKGA